MVGVTKVSGSVFVMFLKKNARLKQLAKGIREKKTELFDFCEYSRRNWNKPIVCKLTCWYDGL